MTDQHYVPQSRGIDPPAQLTNMRLGLATMLECQDAGDGSPRLGLFFGPSGYGKSYAAAAIAARLGAAYVVVQSIWRQRSFLEAIAREIGIAKLERTGPRLLAQIIDQLLVDPIPLIIDETDHLIRWGGQAVEIIRDIHDNARVPVLMIGEESLPAKLKDWERFDNRILVARAAQPSTLGDALLLRNYYCPRVAVEDDLVAAIVDATKGVTRRIVVNLQQAQATAIGAGRDTIDLADWHGTGRRFATGALAPIRKAA